MGDVIHLRPALPPPDQAVEWVSKQTTEALTRYWNSDWLTDADPGCFVIEAIHAEMNKRGHGDVVAI